MHHPNSDVAEPTIQQLLLGDKEVMYHLVEMWICQNGVVSVVYVEVTRLLLHDRSSERF